MEPDEQVEKFFEDLRPALEELLRSKLELWREEEMDLAAEDEPWQTAEIVLGVRITYLDSGEQPVTIRSGGSTMIACQLGQLLATTYDLWG